MALAIQFSPASMTGEQYDEIIRRLEAVGAGAPPARRSHICFGTGSNLRVLDVWESQEAFEAFGAILMPIIQQAGVNIGQPAVSPVHTIIQG